MCWLVGHGITGSHGRCFVVVDACPKKGILSTRAAFNGPYTRVREARNGFGSAALTIFFPIGLSKMAQYGQLFSAAAEMYSSLSRFRLLCVTRLDHRLSRDFE